MGESLLFDHRHRETLEPYLPIPKQQVEQDRRVLKPHVTLTYAQSLDAMIAAVPGKRTALSGIDSKAMTHYLRTRHDAILVGRGTAVADDPTLNSRLEDAKYTEQPRPVILDGRGQWRPSDNAKVLQAARAGTGLTPWVLTAASGKSEGDSSFPVRYLHMQDAHMTWTNILQRLAEEGVNSVMIEGGAEIISSLLKNHMDVVDSLIVTVAPFFLGDGGVRISSPAIDVDNGNSGSPWLMLGHDAVMCAQISHGTSST